VLLESCRPTTVSASGVALNRLRITTKPTATATSRPALSALPLHSNLTERHSGHRTSPPAGTSLAAPAFGRSRRVVWARSGRPVPVEGWSVRLAASLRSHRHVRRSQTGPTCTLGSETVGATFADDNLDLFVRTARDPPSRSTCWKNAWSYMRRSESRFPQRRAFRPRLWNSRRNSPAMRWDVPESLWERGCGVVRLLVHTATG
jgi:hypothetical protein